MGTNQDSCIFYGQAQKSSQVLWIFTYGVGVNNVGTELHEIDLWPQAHLVRSEVLATNVIVSHRWKQSIGWLGGPCVRSSSTFVIAVD